MPPKNPAGGACNKCLTSLLTNLLYQPPHQPLPLAISKMECKAKDHVYIWDLYPTIREDKLESSSSSSSSHQARNIITKPPIAPSHNLSHILPIFSICTIPPPTAPLLPLPYCNPSCCPLASLAITLG